MVTFSDIATCHIFGILLRISVTCDTPYLTTYCISCTLEILGLEENKAYKFTSSYLIPSLEMPKIIKNIYQKFSNKQETFPKITCIATVYSQPKLPPDFRFTGLLDSTWPLDSTVASGNVPHDLPRSVQALPGRPSRAPGSAAIDPATAGDFSS